MKESTLLAAVRKAVNLTGKARLIRNSVGFDEVIKIRYGAGNGSPDLIGVILIPPNKGIAFCIEVKSEKGRLSKEQKAWWRAARVAGIRGGIARSVDDALRLLEESAEQR